LWGNLEEEIILDFGSSQITLPYRFLMHMKVWNLNLSDIVVEEIKRRGNNLGFDRF